MTIGVLKKIISTLDDEMKVGGAGHFGEYLECSDAEVKTVYVNSVKEEILCISIESAGEEPD